MQNAIAMQITAATATPAITETFGPLSPLAGCGELNTLVLLVVVECHADLLSGSCAVGIGTSVLSFDWDFDAGSAVVEIGTVVLADVLEVDAEP